MPMRWHTAEAHATVLSVNCLPLEDRQISLVSGCELSWLPLMPTPSVIQHLADQVHHHAQQREAIDEPDLGGGR